MALLSALGSVTSLGSSLSSIGSVFGISGSKDPGRLAANLRAYNQAVSGGVNLQFQDEGLTPLQFLLQKSPKSRGGGGGWATTKAQEDAWAKLNAAKSVLAKSTSVTTKPATPLGIGGSGSQTNSPVLGGGVATGGGALGEKTGQYVIVGLGILAALYLVKK